ncbi:hypothetical protein [Flavobacterium sp. CAU 1735]|uniref:hypothetical protein n=1 Tax=Flavobacterium sp. CAU 1735 TaxID=3140361 RepID=UPI0032604DAD
MNDQTELTVTETSIAEWIEANLSAPSMLKAQASGTERACCKALFLGSDDSDPNASGTEIFSNPKNLPVAVATILKLIQTRSDFYPDTQNANALFKAIEPYSHHLYTAPFLNLMDGNSIQKDFVNKNYQKIIDDFMTLFSDYSNEDKIKIRNSVRELIQTQSFNAETNTYKNKFVLIIIRNKTNQNADICFYSTSFDMEISAGQPHIKGNQDYTLAYTIYNLPTSNLQRVAQPLSRLPKTTVNEWIKSNSSPKNTAISLCF